jgi:NADP-dependent aldehyde dehydrogenase
MEMPMDRRDRFRSVSPRNGQEFGPVYAVASTSDVDAAVGAAARAAPALAAMDGAQLAAGLHRIAAWLGGEKESLAAIADSETALGTARLMGEVERTTGQLRAFATLVESGEHLRVRRSELRAGPARDLRRVNVPIGVVAVFAASNFPFAFSVAGGDTAAALAAGCPVVVKSHYGHPATSTRVAQIVEAALSASGFPPGSLSLLHGFNETSVDVVTHPLVAAVGFTGSTAGGRALSDLASRRPSPIPVFAEQGSVNPVIVAPSALADVGGVADAFAGSITNGWGQFCTKPGLLLVRSDQADAFAHALISALGQVSPQVLLTAKIAEAFEELTTAAAAVRGTRTWRGEAAEEGFSAAATVIRADAQTLVANAALQTELFGPAAVVVAADSIEEIETVLDTIGGSLTGTIHGDPGDPWVVAGVAAMVRHVGRLIHNGVPTGVAVDVAMHHGGPYPASSTSQHTSVGLDAIDRFMRPVAWQDFPSELLPAAIR